MLEKFQPLYTESYEKQVRLIMLEYETALYMLITGLSLVIATNIDVENSNNNIMIKSYFISSTISYFTIIKYLI